MVTATHATTVRALALGCFLGLVSLASPWLVYLDWSALRPLYAWDLLEHVDNAGGAVELATIACELLLVAALAAATGGLALNRARPISTLASAAALLVAYGALLVGADLATLLIVLADGDALPLWRRALWLSGPTLRAAAVLASVASAALASRRVTAQGGS